MIGTFFVGLFVVAAGVLQIFLGRKAQKEKVIYNSGKSALVTGIKKVEGDWAVRFGKIYVISGSIFIGVGGLMVLSGIIYTAFTLVTAIVGNPFAPTFPNHRTLISRNLYDVPPNGTGYRSRTADGVLHYVEFKDGKVVRDIKAKVGTKEYNDIQKELKGKRSKIANSAKHDIESNLTKSPERKNWYRSKRARQKARERAGKEKDPKNTLGSAKKNNTDTKPSADSNQSGSGQDDDPFDLLPKSKKPNRSNDQNVFQNDQEEDPFKTKSNKPKRSNSKNEKKPSESDSDSEMKEFLKSSFGKQYQRQVDQLNRSAEQMERMGAEVPQSMKDSTERMKKSIKQNLFRQWKASQKFRK